MPSSQTTRYIVRAREDDGQAAGVLTEFARSIEDDPEIALVDAIGPAGQPPHTLVISVPAHRAPALEELFRHTPQLTIERDRPLSLFSS